MEVKPFGATGDISHAICGQYSSRSACASAQSDPRATLSANKSVRPYSTYMSTVDLANVQSDL